MAIGKELTRPKWRESDCASFGSPSLNKKIWTNGPSPRSQLQFSNLVSWILAFCVQESLRSPLTSAGIPIPTPASAWRQSNHIPNGRIWSSIASDEADKRLKRTSVKKFLNSIFDEFWFTCTDKKNGSELPPQPPLHYAPSTTKKWGGVGWGGQTWKLAPAPKERQLY